MRLSFFALAAVILFTSDASAQCVRNTFSTPAQYPVQSRWTCQTAGDLAATTPTTGDAAVILADNTTRIFNGTWVTPASAAAWDAITGKPSFGTAATTAATDYATAAQGATANSALQPTGNGGSLTGLTKAQVGLANADNTSDANKPISTATQTALNGKQASGSYATGTGTANGVNTGDQTITLTGAVTGSGTGSFATSYAGVVPFAQGGIGACAATSATTGVMTVTMTAPCITITPTGAATFNASGGVAGQIATFLITTSGTSSFTLTWGTNFRKVGTLATGTVSARFFSVTFLCVNGTIWQEIARTAVQS